MAADVAADDIIAARRAAEEESELEDEGEERDEEMNGVEDETGAAEEMDTTSSPAEKDGMEGDEETASHSPWREQRGRSGWSVSGCGRSGWSVSGWSMRRWRSGWRSGLGRRQGRCGHCSRHGRQS